MICKNNFLKITNLSFTFFYQDPAQADALCRVQKELDETKVVLHQTLEGLLNRGEKLDDLVSRSDMLSQSSKAFYTTARKTNSWCCTIM